MRSSIWDISRQRNGSQCNTGIGYTQRHTRPFGELSKQYFSEWPRFLLYFGIAEYKLLLRTECPNTVPVDREENTLWFVGLRPFMVNMANEPRMFAGYS